MNDIEQDSTERLITKDSEKDNRISPNQIIQKTCCESICCCFFSQNNVTISEYNLFELLKKLTSTPYDNKNESHNKLLETLREDSERLFKENNINIDKNIWRTLGFQNEENPISDLRGSGVYSIILLNYLLNNYFDQIKDSFNQEFFSFAIVCIRILYLLRLFLFLVDSMNISIEQMSNKVNPCNRRQIKSFCIILSKDNDIFLEIVSKMVIFVKQKYIQDKNNAKKELNLLIIDPIIYLSLTCIGDALNNYSNQSKDIMNLLNNEFAKQMNNNLNKQKLI